MLRPTPHVRLRPADVIPEGWAVDLYDARGRWTCTSGPYASRTRARAKAAAMRRALRGQP